MSAWLTPLDPSIPITGRVLLLMVFGRALASKLRHRDELVGVIADYRLLPSAAVGGAARLVIVLEAAVVLSLASGWQLFGGASMGLALLSAFAAAMAINIARGRTEIDCGCFRSALRQQLSFVQVARNVVLSLFGLPVLASSSLGFDGPPMSVLQLLDGVAGGAVLFILSQAVEQLQAARAAAAALRKR